MQKTDLNLCRKMLEARRADLLETMGRLDNIQIERAADMIDEVQSASMRDFAVARLDWDARCFREVEEALERIQDGGFGVCQNCDEEINPKRLTALPWAALCLNCQEQEDRRRRADANPDLPWSQAA